MLKDARSASLARRFARQWLRLSPVPDNSLLRSMQRETELVFEALLREDRDVLDLLRSNESYLDQKLALHYGLQPKAAKGFVRYALPANRQGLLGQGSILMATSLADRTSPVLRGKWILEVLLGITPSPPPPNVPSLDDTAQPRRDGRALTTRERIDTHARNPRCNSCHRMIDPFGIALEHFDSTGAWRTSENQQPVDAKAITFHGDSLDGLKSLNEVLLRHQDLFLHTFAENLMTYALGRRLEASDQSAVRRVVAEAARKNNRFSAFIEAIVGSPVFQQIP
jgi:Protein of unknown function (DUF1588)/Protein of unknown function (DUF1585)/Protein of unknown function (DUF1592)